MITSLIHSNDHPDSDMTFAHLAIMCDDMLLVVLELAVLN
jgi:hypothetical protein